MTYQGIVNRIQDIVNQHKMLADFGYGDISDLKTRFENTSGDSAVQADYPYLFLTPGTHSRNQGMITYNFNMIVMDMARGEVSDEPYNNTLAIQSQCQQYIDDVLAYLYFGYKDSPTVIYSGATYNPFNERFQDDVAGMTLSLSIQVNQPIDNCITPIEPPVICLPELTVFSTSENRFEYVRDPDESTRWWRWETNTLETPAIGTFADQWFNNVVTGDFEFYVEQRVSFVKPVAGEILPTRPVLSNLFSSYPDVEPTCDSGNWPTEWSSEPITYKAKYNVTINEPTTFGVIGFENPAANESAIIQNDYGQMTIGYLAPPPVKVLDVNSTNNQTFQPDVSGNPQAYPSITTDTYNGMRPDIANLYYIQSPQTGNWVFTESGQARKLVGTEPFVEPRLLTVRPNSGSEYSVQPTTSTFPTNAPIGEVFNYEVTWELELDPSLIDYVAIQDYNDAATEPQYETLAGLNLTATYQLA